MSSSMIRIAIVCLLLTIAFTAGYAPLQEIKIGVPSYHLNFRSNDTLYIAVNDGIIHDFRFNGS